MNSPESSLVLDVLAGVSEEEHRVLARIASTPSGVPATLLEAKPLAELLSRFPNTLRQDNGSGMVRFERPDLAKLFAEAIERGGLAGNAVRHVGGSTALIERIFAAQARGENEEALRLFREGGGVFFMHFHGLDACSRVLRRFPEGMRTKEPLLVFARSMHALKSGNVSRARYLMAERFGPEANDLRHLLSRPQSFSLDLCLFRFLMAMYEDTPISDAMCEKLFDLLGQVPLDDHLQRGSFYNAMLEVQVRKRELDAAMEIAQRARFHYEQANAHLLGFYIDLYLSILNLMRGELPAAAEHAGEANTKLAKVPFETKSDERLIGLVNAVIHYEQGDIEALVHFLNEEFDGFAYGELWPTVAELAINYGGQALSRHIAVAAARVYLDRWRVQEWRSNRFRLVITLREAAILQTGNRWQEATDLLAAVKSRINRTWVESAVETLSRLADPQEIALVMAWLRHLIWEIPTRLILRDQLSELLKNNHLTARQAITLQVWMAHLARVNRDVSTARASLLKALEASGRLGAIMQLVEEADMLKKLLENERIREFVLASGDARKVIRKLRVLDSPVSEGPRKAGLTRQEIKVLYLVAEGRTNKHIARQLGLAEVTVKFHVSNIYRKIGCRRRAEAVATAKALGWVA
ncbi:response regulator transcription factor [Oricola thermophila]|uniref:Response regulator transcription factor n=1 Tax=Oricola thermophila TaxID=2742145 RepID=A0A6N1VHU3_9HYPH|nr:helix-turn-helix transcriptional regulator [Oricola thermophila]QKV20003.1 response regulator transcription factor [Oricola thermophila]